MKALGKSKDRGDKARKYRFLGLERVSVWRRVLFFQKGALGANRESHRRLRAWLVRLRYERDRVFLNDWNKAAPVAKVCFQAS